MILERPLRKVFAGLFYQRLLGWVEQRMLGQQVTDWTGSNDKRSKICHLEERKKKTATAAVRFYLGWNRWGSERAHTVNINVSRRVCVKTISKTLSWCFLQLSMQYKLWWHVSGCPDSGRRGNATSGSSSVHFTVPLINFGRIQQPAQRLSAPSSAVHGYVCFGFKRKGQILNMRGHWLARAQFTHVRTRRLLT